MLTLRLERLLTLPRWNWICFTITERDLLMSQASSSQRSIAAAAYWRDADLTGKQMRESTPGDEELPPPTGTIFVMFVYIGLLIAMWGAAYWILVTR